MLLNSAIFYAVNKLLIMISIQQYLFQEVAKCDERLWKFIGTSRQPFSEFTASVIGAFWALLATRNARAGRVLEAAQEHDVLRARQPHSRRRVHADRASQKRISAHNCHRAMEDVNPAYGGRQRLLSVEDFEGGEGDARQCNEALPVRKNAEPRPQGSRRHCAGNRGELFESGIAWCLANCGKKAVGMRFLIVWGFFVDWVSRAVRTCSLLWGTQRNELARFRSAFQAHSS
jgi:hypothetical protein